MNHLNYHHLQYFWIVAKEEHLTRAAQKLKLSPSALSAQIRQLEEQLGQQLFLRVGRSLKLTEAGQAALGYAETIFATGNELMASMQDGHLSSRHLLRVGSVATLSRNFQENFLKPLLAEPGIHLALSSGNLDELLSQLSRHNLHLILSNKAVSSDQEHPVRCRLIERQPVCLVGKPRGGLAPFRFPDDLYGQRLLLPGPKSEIRAAFDLLCDRFNFQPDVLAEVDDMAMLRLLARDTLAVALLPSVVVQDELKLGRLEMYAMLPSVFEHFYAITAQRRFQHPLLEPLLGKYDLSGG
jgi:LysR family transcriptional activator of nhaA